MDNIDIDVSGKEFQTKTVNFKLPFQFTGKIELNFFRGGITAIKLDDCPLKIDKTGKRASFGDALK